MTDLEHFGVYAKMKTSVLYYPLSQCKQRNFSVKIEENPVSLEMLINYAHSRFTIIIIVSKFVLNMKTCKMFVENLKT